MNDIEQQIADLQAQIDELYERQLKIDKSTLTEREFSFNAGYFYGQEVVLGNQIEELRRKQDKRK